MIPHIPVFNDQQPLNNEDQTYSSSSSSSSTSYARNSNSFSFQGRYIRQETDTSRQSNIHSTYEDYSENVIQQGSSGYFINPAESNTHSEKSEAPESEVTDRNLGTE